MTDHGDVSTSAANPRGWPRLWCIGPLAALIAVGVAMYATVQTDDSGNATVAVSRHNCLSSEELADGWILLFDGETLFGWEPASKANWRVEDGAITVSQGDVGLLCTTSEFGDYTLQLDFRSAVGTNSGVFLRTPLAPDDPATDCYELNIADVGSNPYPTGSFVGRQRADGDLDSDRWQSFEVTARGGHFLIKLDGKDVLDYTDPRPLGRGRIGLQRNQGKVEFRNVKLKPLGLVDLFNGRDLRGWRLFPDRASLFSVTPAGEIHVKNGNGQLETVDSYGDFALQLEVFVNGAGLNSGIFFRSIPGEFWQGYESQIHNGFVDGDRTSPLDYGTGGFYRRQEARRVVADDFAWFHKTLIASGPHMAVWVNGYQVSDWSDPRNPDPNPRRGKRLAAGTISLQGHDPSTDISFRNLRIAELPPR